MADIIYNRFLANLANKLIDIEADVIKVALCTSGYTPNKDHNVWADITNEIVGSGYVAGGKVLANASVTQDDGNDLVKIDGDDSIWTVATIVSRYAVIYNTTVDGLIACIDFVVNKYSSGDDFKIQWSVNGIIRGAQAP